MNAAQVLDAFFEAGFDALDPSDRHPRYEVQALAIIRFKGRTEPVMLVQGDPHMPHPETVLWVLKHAPNADLSAHGLQITLSLGAPVLDATHLNALDATLDDIRSGLAAMVPA
ncbi:hypothetical protein [Deinococcus kurensis]|uniref:hypothetical protein n=1 Tax=Deinococcus kurensis TaxID=2662757 RepID=UPI0012D35AF4|nr:hypothetical protein [Deinococcus kurensis]